MGETRRPRRAVTGALSVVVAVVAVPLFARLTGAHGHAGLVLAAALTPLALPVLLVLALILLRLRRRLLTGLAVLGLVAGAVWTVPLFVAQGPGSGESLVVMTANLRLGLGDPADVVAAVRTHHVDVLDLVELTAAERDRLRRAGLDTLLPHSLVDPQDYSLGSGLWSRLPMTAAPAWTGGESGLGASVTLPSGRAVTYRVVHAFPATFQDGTPPYVRGFADLRRQADALDPGTPVLLAGDFNATRDDVELRRLLGHRYRDAAEVAGDGLQWTFRPFVTGLPLLHLDHVLVTSDWGVRGVATVDIRGSDHLAVVARLVLHP